MSSLWVGFGEEILRRARAVVVGTGGPRPTVGGAPWACSAGTSVIGARIACGSASAASSTVASQRSSEARLPVQRRSGPFVALPVGGQRQGHCLPRGWQAA